MSERISQTRGSHARFDPAYHFFLAPALLLLLIWTIVHLAYHKNSESMILVVLVLLVFVMLGKMRMYSLKVQDRVIRLEERLRLSALLAEPLRSRISEASESQLIALRFASDAELPPLFARALDEKLNPKQIKDAIQQWRGDYWRV
ncbi:MAG TPA: DUF6526 family protein [Bryobacteraceae bacterium]|jgi:hypothetical protein